MSIQRGKLSAILCAFWVLVSGVLYSNLAHALGDLVISPTRVVFEKNTRTASISMVNTGNETRTYRIQFVERRMTSQGGFEEVKQPRPGELFSSNMIRFSPRQVTLEPGQSQAVRLLIRKPPTLSQGEYRSHLLFRAIPKANSTSLDKHSDNGKAISIKLTPVVGISIPIIVRHGQVSARIKVNKLRFFPENSTVLFELQRDGPASTYGDITISFKSQEGNSTVLRKINGLAVYSPNASRRMSVKVQPPEGFSIKNGSLSIRYNQNEEAGGGLIAQHSVQIP